MKMRSIYKAINNDRRKKLKVLLQKDGYPFKYSKPNNRKHRTSMQKCQYSNTYKQCNQGPKQVKIKIIPLIK